MEVILGCNLDGFNPMEGELIEKKSPPFFFLSYKSSMIIVKYKLLSYMLELISHKYGRRFNYLRCIVEIEVNGGKHDF